MSHYVMCKIAPKIIENWNHFGCKQLYIHNPMFTSISRNTNGAQTTKHFISQILFSLYNEESNEKKGFVSSVERQTLYGSPHRVGWERECILFQKAYNTNRLLTWTWHALNALNTVLYGLSWWCQCFVSISWTMFLSSVLKGLIYSWRT